MFYIFLLVGLMTLVGLVGLVLMVRKYYWGPTGRPPQYRYHGDEPGRKTDD